VRTRVGVLVGADDPGCGRPLQIVSDLNERRAAVERLERTGSVPDPVLTAELMAQPQTTLADPLPDPS
jgi:hypothetical protein